MKYFEVKSAWIVSTNALITIGYCQISYERKTNLVFVESYRVGQ